LFLVTSSNFSKAKFGATCALSNHKEGFRRLKVGSLLVSIVQAISFRKSSSLLVGTRSTGDVYGNFWTTLNFGCTINAGIWPQSLTQTLKDYVSKPDEVTMDKVCCLCTKVICTPFQLLVGNTQQHEELASEKIGIITTMEQNEASPQEYEHANFVSSPSYSIAKGSTILESNHNLVTSPSYSQTAENEVDDVDANIIQDLMNNNEDEFLNNCFLENDGNILENPEDVEVQLDIIENENQQCFTSQPSDEAQLQNHDFFEVNNDDTSLQCGDNLNENIAPTGDTRIESIPAAAQLENHDLFELNNDDTALQYGDNLNETFAATGRSISRDTRIELIPAASKIDAIRNSRKRTRTTRKKTKTRKGSTTRKSKESTPTRNKECTNRRSRNKTFATISPSTLTLKSKKLKESNIYEELTDSDDEYYMDNDLWEEQRENMKQINPLICREDKSSCDGVEDAFFKFLKVWTHLTFVLNGTFEGQIFTGYLGVGRDGNGKIIEFAFNDLYIENMSGLTLGYLNNTIKASPGLSIELPKEFQKHQREYASCWNGKQQYEIFLKLYELSWTHIRFFKDPNNAGRNRFQLKNEYCSSFMDYVPKLWFYECLSPEGKIHRDMARKLIKDCKKERQNKWLKIPAGNSYTKFLLMNDTNNLFKIRVKQPAGEPTCIFSSLANGFYFIGDEEAGQLMEHHAKYSIQIVDRMKYAIQLTRNKQYRYNPVRYKAQSFDIFNNNCEWPTVCVLLGDDYSDNHAITIVKDWILDSNAEYAMKVSQENLNWCVSSLAAVSDIFL
jgi:hypothetical protein